MFGQFIRTTVETLLELISVGDIYTDMVVLISLYETVHRAWTTITMFSMLAPFFACHIPFIVFVKELIYRD